MKFQSTRGGSKGLSFHDALFKGFAPDGGMYMPMEIPKLTQETLTSWSQLPYLGIVKALAKLFIEDEIPHDVIDELVDKAFQIFKDPKNPIVTRQLKGNITLMEMCHGKTLTFKDFSMCCTAQFMDYFSQKTKTYATLLVATSGDTGSSALEATVPLKYADAVIMYPKDRISKIQELQMTTIVSDNCHSIRTDTDSDGLDLIHMDFLERFSDVAERCHVGSLNSVNISRLLIQAAHHFYAYFLGKKMDETKDTVIFIPTGGLGNGASALLAISMGLPLHVVCAVTNDALHRTVYDNDYSPNEVIVSLATAMNIQRPYNWERLMYLISGMDTESIGDVMHKYDKEGKATISPQVLEKVKSHLEVIQATDEEILETIRRCHEENDYIVCPHTATGLAAVNKYKDADKYNMVVLSPASPAKFPEAIRKAGVPWERDDLLEELMAKEQRFTDITATDDGALKLKEIIEGIEQRHQAARC